MVNKKQIVLCADDYGLNEAVTQGILTLVAQNRLSATSVMTTFSDLKQHAQQLLNLQSPIATGLHLNLTEGNWLTRPEVKAPKLWQLILKSHAKRLDVSMLVNEIRAQIASFKDAFGKKPDFIDGHQHVHQFPQIREAVIAVYLETYPDKGAFIRATYPMKSHPTYRKKTTILARLGGKALTNLLKKQNIPHQAYFSGIYDFDPTIDFRAYFKTLLQLSPDNTLIMCHPGLESHDTSDTIHQSRYNEWQYFQSDSFMDDINEAGITLKNTSTKIS